MSSHKFFVTILELPTKLDICSYTACGLVFVTIIYEGPKVICNLLSIARNLNFKAHY